MSRVRPALVAVLLVVASATTALAVSGAATAPAEPADEPVVGTSENSTRVLLLTEADAAAFHEPQASVTATLEAGHGGLSTNLQLKTVEQRLAAADSRAKERAVLENATAATGDRVEELLARERAAREAYAAGDITATQYVLTLGSVHANARSLASRLGQTSTPETLYAYARGYSDIRADISRQRARLAMVEGPVRERVASVVHGERDSVRVHVTLGNGVMLSTIDGDQYVRETVRPDNTDDELGGTFSEAPGIVQAQYPWLTNHSTSPSIETRGSYAFYHTANYGHGQITAYIDTTTERVYVERHQQTLPQLPTTVEASTTANNTTLTASRTYAGGPLLVRAANATGVPVDANVSVNGEPAGTTGLDGRLWVLSPAGDYTVTATTADGTTLAVEVTARPAP